MSAYKTTLYFSTLFIEKTGVYKYIYIYVYVYAYYVRILCTHIMYAYYIYHYMSDRFYLS